MNQVLPLSVNYAGPARFSAAEFLSMVETGAFADMKVELIAGGLERMNPPMSGHGGRQAEIVIRLARLIDQPLLTGEVGIRLSDDTVVACDAAILSAPVDGGRILYPEDVALVIEIAETTVARDLGVKRTLYAAADVSVYWVVDGVRRVTHVHAEPIDGDYAAIHTVRFGEPLAVPGTDSAITLA